MLPLLALAFACFPFGRICVVGCYDNHEFLFGLLTFNIETINVPLLV